MPSTELGPDDLEQDYSDTPAQDNLELDGGELYDENDQDPGVND